MHWTVDQWRFATFEGPFAPEGAAGSGLRQTFLVVDELEVSRSWDVTARAHTRLWAVRNVGDLLRAEGRGVGWHSCAANFPFRSLIFFGGGEFAAPTGRLADRCGKEARADGEVAATSGGYAVAAGDSPLVAAKCPLVLTRGSKTAACLPCHLIGWESRAASLPFVRRSSRCLRQLGLCGRANRQKKKRPAATAAKLPHAPL
jgi:hypothetical protein